MASQLASSSDLNPRTIGSSIAWKTIRGFCSGSKKRAGACMPAAACAWRTCDVRRLARGRRQNSPRARERAVDHVDGVLDAVGGNERAEARAFLLAEQHLIEHVEPVERHAGLAVLGFFLVVEERLAPPDPLEPAFGCLSRRTPPRVT